MWDNLFTLLSFSTVMGLASFLAGSVPLSFGLSQRHARIISALGTGLLVGTCLIIIIPEGIETLYSAQSPRDHPHRALHRRADDDSPNSTSHGGSSESHREPHAFVGFSLVLGFIMMYLIDQVPKQLAAATTARSKSRYISLANLSQGPHRAVSPGRLDNEDSVDGVGSAGGMQSSATTIGLVIHAAADGIALAASSFITQSSTGLIVFLAIMIHKAPAAFGLTSVLIKQGYTKRQTRAHLLVFSLAAPVGAIATWASVNVLAGGHISGEEGAEFATGLLLLFSGGTFLYVAMHTMQGEGAESHDHSTDGYPDGNAYTTTRTRPSEQKQGLGLRDTMLTVVGMLLPILAQVGHAH